MMNPVTPSPPSSAACSTRPSSEKPALPGRNGTIGYVSTSNDERRPSSATSAASDSRAFLVEARGQTAEIVDVLEVRGAATVAERARVGQRQPAVAVPGRAPQRACRVAAHPHRRSGPLHRCRSHGVPARLEADAGEAHRLPRPRRRDRGDRLVEAVVAVLEVDAESAELPLEVAGADTEVEPPTGEHVEARRRPRREERVAVGKHAEVGEHAQARRGRGGEGEPDERIEGLVAAAGEPVVIGKGMLGGVHTVETGRLGRASDRGDTLGAHELRAEVDVVGGQGDVDLHAHILPSRRTPVVRPRPRVAATSSPYRPSTWVAFSFWSAMSWARSAAMTYPALIIASRPLVNFFM